MSRGTAAPSPLQDERFLLLASVGRGGMASVYRAFDRLEQRVVALKVVSDRMRHGPGHPLSEEFEAWSRLRHRNVVRAHSLEIARQGPFPEASPYLVLQHVNGLPAHHALEPGRVAEELLERLAVDILRGLNHVHAAGLVHRDVKPGNVLIEHTTGEARLTDFGLAAPSGTRETLGTLNGSLPYVAPEAILGEAVDGRADLYGLGLALYHLASGGPPADERTPDAVLRWHFEDRPADLRGPRPELSPQLSRLVRRLTERNRDDRPSTACEALELLGFDGPARSSLGASTARPSGGSRLRLALDAVRLGDRRVLPLPACPLDSAAVLRELRVRSQILGLRYLDLEPVPERRQSGLEQAVLGLLLERPREADALFRRHSLGRSLPLRLVSGLPVRERTPGSMPHHDARGVARFLLECATDRPLVLHAGGCGDPVLRRTVADLRGSIEADRPALPSPGGMLLVARDERPARLSAATARGSRSRG